MYAELRRDYHNEEENYITIDGWKTDDDNEEGEIVAFVYPERVVYVDNGARLNEEVNELIKEAQEELRECDYYSQIINKITDLSYLPTILRYNVLKKASSFIASGGARNDEYLKNLLSYLDASK